MTKQELNRDIKRLNNSIKKLENKDNKVYFEFIENEAKKEFKRLYHADSEFKYANKQSILIMLRLNVRHRFILFHQFGLMIEI